MKHKLFLILALLLPLAVFSAPTTNVNTLAWIAVTTDLDGNTVTVDGYRVYCSASGPPDPAIATPTVVNGLNVALTTIAGDGSWTCGLTAFKGTLESGLSGTVQFNCTGGACFPFGVPAVPGGLRLQ